MQRRGPTLTSHSESVLVVGAVEDVGWENKFERAWQRACWWNSKQGWKGQAVAHFAEC